MVKLLALFMLLIMSIGVTSAHPTNSRSPELDQDSQITHSHNLGVPQKLMDRYKQLIAAKPVIANSERTSIKEISPNTNTSGRKTDGRESDEVTNRLKNYKLTEQNYKSSEMFDRNERKLVINEVQTDTSELNSDTLQIIKDFFLDEDYTEVIISSQQHLQQIATYENLDDIITSIILIDVANLESKVARTKILMLEDNKQLAYLLVDIQDNVTSLMQTIKATDQRSRIIVMPGDRVDPYQLYKRHGFYNIYIITTPDYYSYEDCHGRYDLYEICKHCNDGEDQVKTINTWVHGRGFIQPLKLPLSFKNTFNQATFQVGTMFIRPFIYVNGTDANGNDIVTAEVGFDILNTLSQMINASFKYLGTSNNTQRRKNLKEKVIQLYGWPFVGNAKVFGGVNTACEWIDNRVIVSGKPPRGITWYGVVDIFDKTTWFLIMLSWVLGGAALYKLRQYTTLGDAVNYGNFYCTLSQIILWDSILTKNHPINVCILLGSFLLGIFVLIIFYSGNLAASMISQDYRYPPIDNPEQLWASSKTILTFWRYNKIYAEMFKQPRDRFETFTLAGGNKWFVPALEKIGHNPDKYVSIEISQVIKTFIEMFMKDQHGNHQFYIGKEKLDFVCINFPVQRESYYEEAVNRGMLTMQATWIIQHIYDHYNFKDFVKGMKAARTRPIISTDPQMVTLQHGFGGGLVLMFAGYTFALFALIYNITFKKNEAAIKGIQKTLRAKLRAY